MKPIRAAGRGMIAAMAMSGMRQLNAGLGLVERTPPQAVLQERVPEVLRSVSPKRRESVIELAHWSYGAAAASLFGLVPARIRSRRLAGPVYGLAMWAVFDSLLAPIFDLSYAREPRPAERVALVLDHLLYGLIVGAEPTGRGDLRK